MAEHQDPLAYDDKLPNLLRTLVFTVRTAFASHPWLAVGGLALVPLGWAAGSLLALWLKLFVDAAVHRDTGAVVVAAALLVANQVIGWGVSIVGQRVGQTFREKAGVVLEGQLVHAAAGTHSVRHLEQPEYLDKLDPLRKETWIVHWTLEALAEMLGAVVQTALTVVLLAAVHPALLALPLFGVPALLAGRAAAIRERDADEDLGEARRRQRHLVMVGTSPSPAKEVRVFGLESRLLAASRATWREEHARRARVTWVGVGWQAVAAVCFAVGFVGALVLVGRAVAAGTASVGDLALVLVLAATMSGNLGYVVQMLEWLVSCLAIGARFLWLVDLAHAEERRTRPRVAVPPRLRTGIELRDLSFRYPGTTREVLGKVSLTLPAGAVVAVVGDNGAGKTTLVKLLCGMYEPTGGTVCVDGHELSAMDLRAWRARCTGAFQDHARFEVTVREAVALGNLDRRDEPGAVEDALAAAGADDLAGALPHGLDTQLGLTWPGGTDLSGGQWQKVALARGLMRPEPLLTVLDEPTASLDAQTEDALFTRYAREARRQREGNGVTLLVSHRFSTVRSADLIVVLAGGGVVEQGTHEELTRQGGTYAELYELQGRGYR